MKQGKCHLSPSARCNITLKEVDIRIHKNIKETVLTSKMTSYMAYI